MTTDDARMHRWVLGEASFNTHASFGHSWVFRGDASGSGCRPLDAANALDARRAEQVMPLLMTADGQLLTSCFTPECLLITCAADARRARSGASDDR